MWLYYALLKPGEDVNVKPYRLQLMHLSPALRQKLYEIADRRDKGFYEYDNAPLHVAVERLKCRKK